MNITTVEGLAGCPAPKSKKMFINIATYSMYGVASPPQFNCNPGASTCGVSLRLL